jgi:hypothetical protein
VLCWDRPVSLQLSPNFTVGASPLKNLGCYGYEPFGRKCAAVLLPRQGGDEGAADLTSSAQGLQQLYSERIVMQAREQRCAPLNLRLEWSVRPCSVGTSLEKGGGGRTMDDEEWLECAWTLSDLPPALREQQARDEALCQTLAATARSSADRALVQAVLGKDYGDCFQGSDVVTCMLQLPQAGPDAADATTDGSGSGSARRREAAVEVGRRLVRVGLAGEVYHRYDFVDRSLPRTPSLYRFQPLPPPTPPMLLPVTAVSPPGESHTPRTPQRLHGVLLPRAHVTERGRIWGQSRSPSHRKASFRKQSRRSRTPVPPQRPNHQVRRDVTSHLVSTRVWRLRGEWGGRCVTTVQLRVAPPLPCSQSRRRHQRRLPWARPCHLAPPPPPPTAPHRRRHPTPQARRERRDPAAADRSRRTIGTDATQARMVSVRSM